MIPLSASVLRVIDVLLNYRRPELLHHCAIVHKTQVEFVLNCRVQRVCVYSHNINLQPTNLLSNPGDL